LEAGTDERKKSLIVYGDKDPVDFRSEVVTNANNEHDSDLRVQASALLAPCLHSNCGAMPPSRFIEQPLEIPHRKPTTLDHVQANIAHIIQAFAVVVMLSLSSSSGVVDLMRDG